MKYLKDYLKDRLLYLLLIFTVVLFINGILLLYLRAFEIVAYIDISLLIIILAFLSYDLYKYLYKRRELAVYYDNIPYGQMMHFKERYDEEYQKIIDRLEKILKDKDALLERKEKDMIDYYTLWVHQIKTPIAAMALLADERGDIELKSELIKIEQYVNMVLGYLRINSESTDFVFEKIDLDKVIKEVIKEYAVIFISKKLAVDYQKIDHIFVSDEKWFAFVLSQVVSNALKYTKTGGIKIYKKDHYLVVEDSGIGIMKEDLPRVFEKGFSGHQGRKDKRASGIGLYLAKKILKELGSDIFIESEYGKMTKVYIDISDKKTIIE